MKYKYWLSNISGISGGKIRSLLEHYKDAEEIFFADEASYGKIPGITPADAKNLELSKKTWNPEEKWYRFQETGIQFITMEDAAYPGRLKHISSPPYSLYVKGKMPQETKKAVGIVGARGRSAYGCSVARQLGENLGKNGISVISGLARGIDADAHAGAIHGGGVTFAVLGCGVDVIYPKENAYLYEEIVQTGGGILSEYPLHTPAQRPLFPARNRIISGLSDAVCVVEARKKSGSLITADYAMEQGRDVYAVPGSILDPLSEGCNELIFQGAIPLLHICDVAQNLLSDAGGEGLQTDFRNLLLEKDEALVYSFLDFQPHGLENLFMKTQLDCELLMDILERLQNKGFIREIIPNYFVRTI